MVMQLMSFVQKGKQPNNRESQRVGSMLSQIVSKKQKSIIQIK